MKGLFGRVAVVCCLVVGVMALTSHRINADEHCNPWVGRLVSLQGQVFVKKAGRTEWSDADLDETFCAGDQIRVAANSRAAFVLSNEALLRADQNTSLVFSGIEREPSDTLLLEFLKGVAHFFSRRARSLKVVTPFVNGTVEGTEFLVQVDRDKTLMALFEGRLRTENSQGSLLLAAGQAVTAVRGQPPQSYLMVHPREAVQWALYYPPVLSLGVLDPESVDGLKQRFADARHALALGKPNDALSLLESLDDLAVFVPRAALRLQLGQVDKARSDLQRVLENEPHNGRALALQAVMAVVQNRKDEALALAHQAVQAGPRIAATYIALSYALQARFNLQGARDQIQKAVTVEPENGLTWARLAELQLAMGNLKAALTDAFRATELAPGLARSKTILGFAHLVSIDTPAARQNFLEAIDLDSAAPLPRLGLGIAMIRDGELEAGRAQIEISAGLDPDNAMIRSYLGKAYFDEKRGPKDGQQLAIAKRLDPNDPTPWYYDAIRKQSLNRPVEALHDLEKAIELNDNRAVYRSRFQLDEDLAARSVSLGRIYNDLGFQQLGLVEGWKSVSHEPDNFSVHRLLADLYAALPRHEHARSSELLQAQLLQPITLSPVQPHLDSTDQAFVNNAGPLSPSLNEYSQLYVRNRLAGQINAVAGEKGTEAEEVILSAVQGPLSLSAGQFFFNTDGFRENNDQTLKAHDLFGQISLSPRTSAQFAYQWLDEDKGDLSLKFDKENFTSTLRHTNMKHSLRLGLRHNLTARQSFLLSGLHADIDEEVSGLGPFTLRYDSKPFYYEGIYYYQGRQIDVTAGAGDYRNVTQETFSLIAPPVTSTTDLVSKHRYYYIYNYLTLPKTVTWILGVSQSYFEDSDFKENQINPKLGIIWQPSIGTTLRSAYFRNLNREYLSMPTLEPSNVAGFNQLFDDGPGSDVWCKAVGIDLKPASQLKMGAEYIRREIKILYLDRTGFTAVARNTSWEEDLYRGYLYWIPNSWVVPALDVFFEQFTRTTGPSIPTDISEMQTWRVAPKLSIFPFNGVSLKITATYIQQSGRFYNYVDGLDPRSASFWFFDGILCYRLPRRFGQISLKGTNIFNESFSFQDTDPDNSFVSPDRQFLLQFSFQF